MSKALAGGAWLEDVTGLPFEIAVRRISSNPDVDDSDVPFKAYIVVAVRFASLNADPPSAPIQPADMCTMYLIQILSALQIARLLPKNVLAAPWFTPLAHRCLILAALLTAAEDDPTGADAEPAVNEDVFQTLVRTTARLARWVRGGLGTGDPAIMAALRHIHDGIIMG
ncbi:hypothetical protein JCM10450v2_003472 [Rhodotorula kratochvilovae]